MTYSPGLQVLKKDMIRFVVPNEYRVGQNKVTFSTSPAGVAFIADDMEFLLVQKAS
jgi:hypothetical protein